MNIDRARLAPGTQIDGFRVGAVLHEGGMATLYRVSREGEQAPLLMKVPHLAYGSHPAAYVCFESEQMILARLSGPHVPRLVAAGDLAQNPYLVLEQIAGPSLAEYARRAPLAPREVARLIGAAATAVHALHHQNVVHLDLKPANIRLRPTGEAVLIDFGLARHAELPDLGGEAFTLPLGTGAYISPEQLEGNRADPRSDVYALGVIAYQLATGAMPFGEPTTRLAMRRRIYLDALPPRAVDPRVPDWLQEIILRCLEARAEERYATAAQLAHDLAFPEQVPLTERARRLRRRGGLRALARWLGGRVAAGPLPSPSVHLARSPHLLVAVDLEHGDEPLAESMRAAVRRALAAEPGARVTLLTVNRGELFGEDAARQVAQAEHVAALVALRHWISPLRLAGERLRFHVAQSPDPAGVILEYAATHEVDRVIMGARGASRLRRYLGSVSSRVVAEAPCSVSVTRPRRGGAPETEPRPQAGAARKADQQ